MGQETLPLTLALVPMYSKGLNSKTIATASSCWTSLTCACADAEMAAAAAAEIFTAALQDNRRALVIGSKTFGKGRIQNVQPLENGTGVAVTKARYVTPRGRDLHGKGIEPNRVPNRCEAEDAASACLEGIV